MCSSDGVECRTRVRPVALPAPERTRCAQQGRRPGLTRCGSAPLCHSRPRDRPERRTPCPGLVPRTSRPGPPSGPRNHAPPHVRKTIFRPTLLQPGALRLPGHRARFDRDATLSAATPSAFRVNRRGSPVPDSGRGLTLEERDARTRSSGLPELNRSAGKIGCGTDQPTEPPSDLHQVVTLGPAHFHTSTCDADHMNNSRPSAPCRSFYAPLRRVARECGLSELILPALRMWFKKVLPLR